MPGPSGLGAPLDQTAEPLDSYHAALGVYSAAVEGRAPSVRPVRRSEDLDNRSCEEHSTLPRIIRGLGAGPVGSQFVKEQPLRHYAPVGTCIYCGASPVNGDEHIIPDWLGGRWILPDASCRKCEGMTSAIEGAALRGIFNGSRNYLGIAKRRARERAKGTWMPVNIRGSNASSRLPATDLPAFLIFPVLDKPGVLGGEPGVRMFWTLELNMPWSKLRDRGINKVNFVMDFYKFSQFLAKIAHSFVAAEIGLTNFTPLLLDMITRKNPMEPYLFIGSELEPTAFTLHTLRLARFSMEGVDYVGARIRLFAHLNTPTYVVIAGTLKSPLIQSPQI